MSRLISTYTKLIGTFRLLILQKILGEKKNMQRIQCPVCKEEGVLQWKETITKAKRKMYHYKKLYVYHQHPQEHPKRPKWCYLTAENIEALGITQNTKPITQNLTQNKLKENNLKSSPIDQSEDAVGDASIAQSVEQQPCKL
jgi:hypothetical protein